MAVALGTLLGIIVGVLLTTKIILIKALFRIYVELFRGCPLLVQLFMVYFGLPHIGLNVDLATATVLVFTLYSGAYVAEIVRQGIESISKGQWEAAQSLGLGYFQIMIRIIFPQTIKIVLAPLIGFYIGMIKDTSLASIIGYSELVKKSQTIMNMTTRPFETYILVGLCYFIVCYPLSKLVKYIEKRNTIYDRT
jgi:polar amino acid transport system permease protein